MARAKRKPVPTIKVKIETVTTTESEVEIPIACPKCGQDFTDPDVYGLIEDQYITSEQGCQVDAENKSLGDDFDAGENFYEGGIATGYRCGNCRLELT